MQRVLEPEVMDSLEEAIEYDAMDFTSVNQAFAHDTLNLAPVKASVLDAGTGTARIPILIASQRPDWQIIAVDLSPAMLEIADKNVREANLSHCIDLQKVDAKKLPYGDDQFDLVISNSLVHHLTEPLPFFQEVKRVLRPQGGLLFRDLLRPASLTIVEEMVKAIGPDYSPQQTGLFSDSLRASFTLDEISALLSATGLHNINLYQSSDRHWTAIKSFGTFL
ncbi:MAG: 2-methoxy-6-polyprenyl-1,4-benzoquinol methylase, mitochondrial [Chroococcopsis gigantea SAG 12.99]|nr:class I SAM-dependent methyltransferase [Chlorogloea purpurea SAG 13.99]MDV3001691.1 2-methoxy-6-polyprenyl-1,4-benzoquinol methylase, mitochondrial [Chroococcopsis gigantea SAG 12.99]